jgi:putative nucleotidyltransferase with HDIG domain
LPGSPAHLFRRFFDVAMARGLDAAERVEVVDCLTPDTAPTFFAQDDADQRHAFHAAQSVIASGVEEEGIVMAALMHDIGKRHARLGLVGRSLASILILLRLPLSGRMIAYRDHGLVGAHELAALSVPSLVVDFAMHHHGSRPPTIEPRVWDALVAADQPQRHGRRSWGG